MSKRGPIPPRFFHRFFRWYCHPKLLERIEGDLFEVYFDRVERSGRRTADLKFIVDVLLLCRPRIIRPLEGYQNVNSYGMLISYLKMGWRNLVKDRGYSMINIGGLALGMSVAVFIGLWIYDELSFNRYHRNYNTVGKLYRVNDWANATPVHTTGLGTVIKSSFPNVFKYVVLVRQRIEERVLADGYNKFTQRGYFMQPDGVDMLGLEMLKGTPDALNDMKSVILSESTAKKIFGDRDPLNQTIVMDAKWDLNVTGVYKDLPKNSDFFEASYFAPLDLYLDGWSDLNVWDNYNMNIYVQLQPGKDFTTAEAAIRDAMLPHVDPGKTTAKPQLFILPMAHWHLYAEFQDGVPVTSEKLKFVYFYGTIGAFVLLLGCINFMNLSTARSEKRAREVGIRKAVGSQRSQLISQFFSESLLVATLSFAFAILVVWILLPGFNAISDKSIVMPWGEPLFWLGMIAFVAVTGALAGSYPALYLSSFSPVRVLKGKITSGRYSSWPRKTLVILQFTVSISLIAGTVVVYQQIQFAKNRPAGYERSGLISVHSRSPELKGKYEALRTELKRTGVVDEMAESNYAVTSTLGWNGGFEWRNQSEENKDATFNINEVTYEYGKTIGWNFVKGRDFDRGLASDARGVVINETAAKLMGFEDPVGEVLVNARSENREDYTILGVITDMIKGNPFERSDACLFFVTDNDQPWIYIRLNAAVGPHEALPKVASAFGRVITTAPFDYKFADEEYDAKFRGEERVGTLAAIFSALAILISCAGLVGLASFVAEQRTKEIGIRKVLGAGVGSVWQLLSRDFIMLVGSAALIAIPAARYFLGKWLEQYDYRVDMSWWIFFVAGAGAMVVTILVVSMQVVKVAVRNPVRSLRSE